MADRHSRSVLAIVMMLAAAGPWAVGAAGADIQKGGTPVKHRPVHGPGSTHDPIVRHPPLHGAGSSHHPIHHTKSPARRCDPPPCPVKR